MSAERMRRAERSDVRTGIREIAEYFGHEGGVFGFTHLPADEPHACVLICSGVHAAAFKNYRREVELGRELATNGIAVQRFHYRGQGNSAGSETDTTFDSMVEDAVIAAERIMSISGTERVGFLGATLGSLVAAGVATHFDGAPLVLWDPATDGRQYFRDVFRAQRMLAMRSAGQPDDRSSDDEPLISVAGYSISRRLRESALSHRLADDLGYTPRAILLLLLGDKRTKHPTDELAASWRRRGFTVDEYRTGEREAWWFSAGPEVEAEARDDATSETSRWLRDQLMRETMKA